MPSSQRATAEPDREAGLSLAELLVAMMVLAIVMVMITSFFVSGTRVLAQSDAVGRSNGVASNVINEASRVIRSATGNKVEGIAIEQTAIIEATAESVTMYSTIDSPSALITPRIVRLQIDAAGNLVESRWAHSSMNGDYFLFPALGSAPTVTRVIGGPLGRVAAGNAALFSYLTADGAVLPVPGGGLSETARKSVARVLLTVSVDADKDPRTKAVILENSVRLPQLGLSEGG